MPCIRKECPGVHIGVWLSLSLASLPASFDLAGGNYQQLVQHWCSSSSLIDKGERKTQETNKRRKTEEKKRKEAPY